MASVRYRSIRTGHFVVFAGTCQDKAVMITKKPWFKRKTYGWGWTPSTWQGWAVLALYLFGAVKGFVSVFAPGFLLLTAALIAVCYLTGEKPRWQWGKKKDDDK